MTEHEQWLLRGYRQAAARCSRPASVEREKPRLRWRHNSAYPAWIAGRADGFAVTAVFGTDRTVPEVRADETLLVEFATGMRDGINA